MKNLLDWTVGGGQLRFASLERDAFTPESGYPAEIVIDGPLRDRVWLEQSLNPARSGQG